MTAPQPVGGGYRLAYTYQREIVQGITEAKREEMRCSRIVKTIEMLKNHQISRLSQVRSIAVGKEEKLKWIPLNGWNGRGDPGLEPDGPGLHQRFI